LHQILSHLAFNLLHLASKCSVLLCVVTACCFLSSNYHIFRFVKIALLFTLVLLQLSISAQQGSLNFHHLTTANGLSDPIVRSIASDKYGYTWFGTLNGLNRFNGYEIKVFQHQFNDSFSLAENTVPALLCDYNGTLWVAQSKGLYKYDYSNARFILQPGSTSFAADKMLEGDMGKLYIGTSGGMVVFDTRAATFAYLSNKSTGLSKFLLTKPVNDFCLSNGKIYIATDTGVLLYDLKKKVTARLELKPVKNKSILKVEADTKGQVWMSYIDNGAMLLRTDSGSNKYQVYSQFGLSENSFKDNKIHSIFCDDKGRIWIATSRLGILLFNAELNTFTRYNHDHLQPSSLATNFAAMLYQDKKGFMWVGTEGYGAEYFHPDKNLFHSIQQSYNQTPTLPDNWARASSEDKDGNLWLATANGLAKYDPNTGRYTIFKNTDDKAGILYNNSVRSVLCDEDVVWIGTREGLNRYHIGTGKMDFFGEKDSVPKSFFWNIIKDHENNIWFCCNSGLYKYDRKSKRIECPVNDIILAPYCKRNIRVLFEDSKNRLWIAPYSGGLLMYDVANKQAKYFHENMNRNASLNNDIVTSLAEDKGGIIWMTTLSGIHSYNVNANLFKNYSNSDANISEITSSIMCDDNNRLWVAASSGLYLLDSARAFFKTFTINDGLPTIDFNHQLAFKMQNGNFVYPTLKGFVLFNPKEYKEKSDCVNVYISSFKIFEKEFIPSAGIEQMTKADLNYDQNFFSFKMTAINYANPNQNWYAYKLEPFDKQWIYTKDRIANYTNVPGGTYTFYYKTSTDNGNWNVTEKTIQIHVSTVFYKTWWFSFITVIIMSASIYLVYRKRIVQKEKMLLLEKKAYSLEKEKALVMYESLKQQLNPHFLFNSLTSLSSLISSNPVNAKQFLERLSKIYRYILKSRDNETVPLSDELKLAEIYTQLQRTRFKEGLQLKTHVPEEYMSKKIAPVTLQNLIENAMKHNIIDVTTPLVITIFVENDWLVVSNNLQKKGFVESSNKQGLANMQSLYFYLSGRQIIIIEDENYYTIKLPLL